MKLQLHCPAESLNKAYLKQCLSREQIDVFKTELKKAFNHIDEKQDEEYHKNIIADLFKTVYCKDKYLVNVNKKDDLVFRLGNSPKDAVGVLLEFKKPTEKRDMVSANNANVKALQELVLYYLRQTVDNQNFEIKNVIVTNIYDWFIFDGVWFEKNIFRNTKLKKEYENWKISGQDTKHFYDHIAAKYLAEFTENVPCTYFNIKDYETKITNDNPDDDNDLIDLYKILSPEHLLKQSFANDSNSLNVDFYNELLYIFGLEEKQVGAKRMITRMDANHRLEGSFIENTIDILKRKALYNQNDTSENNYFETALELCITWLNRILFLKLLENQLINFHLGDKLNYGFLSNNKLKDFDELDELFFDVLAEKPLNRKKSVADKYKEIPYLNSSLFEMTDLEKNIMSVSNLKDRLQMPLYKKTVLKKDGKMATGNTTSFHYLLDFLDAYNFASDSNAKIQEDNKTIINAAVLGLIFEKLNGYKDGSFFTPGFITMYMCRESIRKTVLEKFKTNFEKCENIIDFEDLKDKIDYTDKNHRAKANELINSIRICDPAVGSGHFLVSALNEMIAVKADLGVLCYQNGMKIRGHKIVLENDELTVFNEEIGKLFEYQLNKNNSINSEIQELQEALFKEKQTIIENCLFGVDINPKSVMICQLRLWIELLKNAYYTKESQYKELETLPNIDINIKTGNSLISKFAIKDNLFENVSDFKSKIKEYKNWVYLYKTTNDKNAKRELNKNLNAFKNQFYLADPRLKILENDLRKVKNEHYDKYLTHQFFNSDLTVDQITEKTNLEKQIVDKENEIENAKTNPVYKNSFEWRYEFPEVLTDDGDFIGFDIVVGNPPYISNKEIDAEQKAVLKNYKTAQEQYDLYSLFIEKSLELTIENGENSLIIPDSILGRGNFKSSRMFLHDNTLVQKIVHLDNVFDEAAVSSCIYFLKKQKTEIHSKIEYIKVKTVKDWLALNFTSKQVNYLTNELINSYRLLFLNELEYNLLLKIFKNIPLQSLIESWRGEEIGKKNDFVLNEKTKDAIQILTGENIDRYSFKKDKKYILEKNVSKDLKKYRKEKIVIRQLGLNINAQLDFENSISVQSVYNIYSKNADYSNQLLLGLLNSKMFDFIYKSVFAEKQQFPRILLENIRSLCVPEIDKKKFNSIETLVNQVIATKKENPTNNTDNLETQIDNLVYQLYDLTDEEIEIINAD